MTFDGWRRVIADCDHPGPVRVGRYGVDVAAIDALVERSLAPSSDARVFLIDEVGKIRLSRKALLDPPEGYEPPPPGEGDGSRQRRRGGGGGRRRPNRR